MKKTIQHITLLSVFLLSAPQAFAGLISNGNFGGTGNCNLTGWDQAGDVAASNESGGCSAVLSVNDSPDFEAELSQEISLENDTDYTLTVNYDLSTTNNSNILDDYFSISLLNADFDYIELFSMNIFNNENMNTMLTIDSNDFSSYSNQDWTLSLFLMDDVDPDTNSSSVTINSVLLEGLNTDIPEPSSLAIFVLGLAALVNRRKLANELVRKSINK